MAKPSASWNYAAEQVPLLNRRQREILDLIERGLTNQEIADHFEITLSGAKWHVSELLSLLAMSSREEMAEFWAWRGARTSSGGWRILGLALSPKSVGAAAACVVAAGIVVPWLVLRGGEAGTSDDASGSPAPSPALLIAPTLAPWRGLAAYAIPLPAKGPEGRLAYLDPAGNLMVKPLPAGSASLARNSAQIRTPRWSASGHYLAVVENGFLIVVPESGVFVQLTNIDRDGTWAWSPADDVLALFTGEGFILYDAKTGAKRVLRGQGAPLPEQPGALAWSPDGRRILYSFAAPLAASSTHTVSELRVVDVRSGVDLELIRRETPPQSGTPAIGWSGTGESVFYRDLGIYASSAWVDGVPLYVQSLAGGPPVKLGTSLGGGDMFSARPGEDEVAYLQGAAPGSHSAVAWSPDGRLLAYTALPEPAANQPGSATGQAALDVLRTRKLWVQEPGTAARQLTSDVAYRDEHPMWSDDGASLLFTRIDAAGKASVWRVAAAGGSPEVVVAELGLASEGDLGVYGWVSWEVVLGWGQ